MEGEFLSREEILEIFKSLNSKGSNAQGGKSAAALS